MFACPCLHVLGLKVCSLDYLNCILLLLAFSDKVLTFTPISYVFLCLILICPQEPLKSLRPRKVSTPASSSQKAREEKALLPLEVQDDGSDSELKCSVCVTFTKVITIVCKENPVDVYTCACLSVCALVCTDAACRNRRARVTIIWGEIVTCVPVSELQ